MLCVLVKVLSYASAKKITKRHKGFKFRTYWPFSSEIMAVKGLNLRFCVLTSSIRGKTVPRSRLVVAIVRGQEFQPPPCATEGIKLSHNTKNSATFIHVFTTFSKSYYIRFLPDWSKPSQTPGPASFCLQHRKLTGRTKLRREKSGAAPGTPTRLSTAPSFAVGRSTSRAIPALEL